MPGYSPVTGQQLGARRERAGRRDVTYVALVHGVATQDPDEWAAELLSRIVRRWSEREEYAVTTSRCAAECPLTPGRHRHLLVTRGGRAEHVDLEAVYWGYLVRAGSWPAALRQSFHIGGAVLLADFAAIWASVFGSHAYRTAAEDRPGPVLAIGRLLSLLVRLLAAPLIVAGLIALTASTRFRLAVADIYRWMTDDVVRAEIVGTVTDAVQRARAERVVLVGHSQGGSVVLQARRELLAAGRIPADDPVITFGSADPLLGTVRRAGIQGGLGRYWLLLMGLWVLSVVMATVPAAALASLLILAWKLIGAALVMGGGLWLLPAGAVGGAPDVVSGLVDVAHAGALRDSLSVLALCIVPAVVAAGIIGIVLAGTGLARRILAGPAAPDHGAAADSEPTPAPGHDVVARDDPLAPLARAVGPRRRLRQIPQTSSILLDHQSYFRNSATSLPFLFADVWHRAVQDAGQPDDCQQDAKQPGSGLAAGDSRILLTRWYRTGLRRRRLAVFLAWAACVGAVALWPAPGPVSAAVFALLALSGGAAWARLVLLWRWMERMDIAARTGPHVLARSVRRRRGRRSVVFAVVLAVAAVVALGGATVSAAASPATILALAVLGAGLAASAVWSLSGAALPDAVGMTCLVAFSALWLVSGPAGWIAVGIAAAACAFRAVTLVREYV